MKKATTRCIDGEKYEMLETMFQELGISLDLAYMPNISNKDMVAEDYEKAIADLETIQNKSLDELKDLFTKSIEQDAIFFDDEYLEKSLNTNFISYTHSGAVEKYLMEYMGYAESYAYAKAHPFDKAQKQVYIDFVEQLRQTFRERINNNDWMSEASKQNAIEKLNGMTINIGEPDEWIEEGRGDISNEQTILDDMLAMRRSNLNLLLKLIGMPKDKAAFHMGLIQVPLSYVQAFYIRNLNAIYIYPEFMTPPAFDPQQNDAHNYATLVIAGHEMTHGYDVNGVKWDKDGNPSNILATEAEAKEFEKRSKQLIDYYSSLDIWPLSLGLKNDGAFTADENVADLGGFILAYNSYQKHLKKQGFEGEQLRLQQQRFYEAYAYVWCDKWSDVYALAITTDDLSKDNHSLPRERVNGVVTNTDDWYDLFDVTPANKFYVAPQSRVRIW
jgi:putative endopeptidase